MDQLKTLIFVLALFGTEHAQAADTGLVVAWDERETSASFIGILDADAPSAFLRPPMAMPRNGWLRAALGDVFHVSLISGMITRVDPQAWVIRKTFDFGAGAELRDIFVASSATAFVSSASSDALLKLDLRSGQWTEAVNLAPVGVAPGELATETMMADAGRLYVQLRRPLGSMEKSAVAVVDLATETLIDVDPDTSGVQAIELMGTEPRLKMQRIPGTRRLMLSATGASLDFGGLETIDLDLLQSEGLVLREHLDTPLNDLGPFVMLDGERGWYSGSTDIVLSSHLHPFTLSEGGLTRAVDNVTFFFAPVIVHETDSDRIFWPVPDGLKFFDADSGAEAGSSPTDLFIGDPTDLALVPLGGLALNAGLNGNWWNGPARDGEGLQIEVVKGGSGGLVLVATFYSYDPDGNQIFLISVGEVIGNKAEVEVFITSGGLWGDEFDPALVQERLWGHGLFTASSCDAMHMALVPNAEALGLGYTNLAYDLVRLTTPAIPCPLENEN